MPPGPSSSRSCRTSRWAFTRSGSRPTTDSPIRSSSLSASFRKSARRKTTPASRQPRPLPAPPLVVEGETAGNDVDYFRFAGKKGQVVVVDAQCARIGSGMDPTIRLTTAADSRRFVASADDSPGLLTDARLVAELPEDTDYVVEISDSRYQGAGRPVYRLLIGSVPVADEVFPLGGREGETLGLELRGGTLGEQAHCRGLAGAFAGHFLAVPRLAQCDARPARIGRPRLSTSSRFTSW